MESERKVLEPRRLPRVVLALPPVSSLASTVSTRRKGVASSCRCRLARVPSRCSPVPAGCLSVFRFLLRLEDGEPPDPATVRTVADEEVDALIKSGVPITEVVRYRFVARVIARAAT
jgi:hypothetical protein